MKSLIGHISFLLAFSRCFVSLGQGSTDLSSRVAYQVALVQESKTADDIYLIKSRIDKLSQESKTYNEKKQIRDAYLLISDKFAFYSHFKSGALVYFSYLELNDELHQLQMKTVNDSIQTLRNTNATGVNLSSNGANDSDNDGGDSDKIKASTDESNSKGSTLISSKDSSSGLNLKLVLGITVAVVLMIFVFLGQRKKIAIVKSSLEKDQSEIKHLFRISSNVSMLSGAIRYAREFSAHCAAVLSDLIEITNQNKSDSKVDSSKASQAINVFKRISNGENRPL